MIRLLGSSSLPPGGGGGVFGNSSWRCAARFSKSWPYQTKKFHFSNPFSDHTSKIHIRFQTFRQKSCYYYLDYRAQRKIFKSIWIRLFLFLSYQWLETETINTFIHSRSSRKNHTRFQTKMSKVYTGFQTKTAQKSYPVGRYITI